MDDFVRRRRLAEAKINVLDAHVIGKAGGYAYDSITVDKPAEAKSVLGSAVVNRGS